MNSQLLEAHAIPAPEWVDQRVDLRTAVDLPGTLDIVGWRSKELLMEIRVIDISANGAMVEGPDIFPYDVVLILRVDALGEFKAEKLWSTNDHRMGLKFVDALPEIFKIVRR